MSATAARSSSPARCSDDTTISLPDSGPEALPGVDSRFQLVDREKPTMAKSTKKAAKGKAAPKAAAKKKQAPPAKKKAASKVVAKAKAVVAKVKAVVAKATKPVKVTKPVAAAKPVAAPKPLAANVDEQGLGWVDAGKGYQLTLDGGKLAAKNDKGKRLTSVPKDLKEGDVADQLEALRDWLIEHDRECIAQVEQWMLRSLPVPRAVLQAVWEDPSWRRPLENAVVVAVKADGGHDLSKAGLFRGVDAKKGVGIVDLDGETGWLATDRVAIPHPILIQELDGWRELVTQLGVTQGIAQLHRETHPKEVASGTSIDKFEDGKFAMLMHAVGKARALGYKVRGGFATCQVWDAGAVSEARFWIGADSPDSETYTGQLSWVDGKERGLKLADVGPVAFSEGMRMAAAIYAARVVEKQEEPS
jgi:hypothetical protein